MSGLCGWIGLDGCTPSPERVLAAMSEPLTRFDASGLQSMTGASWGLAVSALGKRASIAREGSCIAVVWGQLEPASAGAAAGAASSAHAVIARYRSTGPECLSEFTGSAALVILDEEARAVYVATDRIGAHPIVHATVGGTLVFASTADSIHRYPGQRREVEWQSLYNYVHFHVVPGPATAFRGQTRLMPGEYLAYKDGKASTRVYWKLRYVEDIEPSFEALRSEFRPMLADAVRRHTDGEITGAFLSGGTDSSTIAGLLGQVTGEAAPTFSIGFDASGYDEMEYARIAAKRFATDHHEYYLTPADIVDAIPRLADIHDQPFGNSSAVPTYFCARLAKSSGMQLLLGGDGGDELFGGNERYATQQLFSHYERLPRAMRHGLIEPLARVMPSSRALLPLRWFRRAVELASTPMPERLDAYNLLLQFGPENVFSADVLAQVDRSVPSALMRDSFSNAHAGSLINRMLAFDMRFTIADSDLPKVVRSCELAGIPVSFPLLDHEVVEFSARLAPAMKLRGSKLRYFFKEALRGFLPDEIITKKKHGFGMPFGVWLSTHRPLEELVGDSLNDLKKRGVVQPALIDSLLSERIATAPGYYGTMAWVLMMLEGWFQRHVDCA
jgi:asparagine synthase (glutamine-hydrolysing)